MLVGDVDVVVGREVRIERQVVRPCVGYRHGVRCDEERRCVRLRRPRLHDPQRPADLGHQHLPPGRKRIAGTKLRFWATTSFANADAPLTVVAVLTGEYGPGSRPHRPRAPCTDTSSTQ